MPIRIVNKSLCCGCSACVQKCPKQCISMCEDKEGFLYPVVDEDVCVKCGLCEKVCTEYHPYEMHMPLHAYACKNPNEDIREVSSSGGVFTLLAEKILEQNGVVFGTRYDENWKCVHDYIEEKKDIVKLRGSKYIASKIGDNFNKTLSFLKEGRKVLFVGTSCQIAGLNHFLGREYENLFTVEITCHGIPSPFIWEKYINEETKRMNVVNPVITGVNFRKKEIGWKRFSLSLLVSENTLDSKKEIELSEEHEKNAFMKLFLNDYILRPSCYQCPAKSGKTKSDLTLADFWHIDRIMPDYDDDKGVTLVYVNTDKGLSMIQSLNMDCRVVSVKDATELKTAWFMERRPIPRYRRLLFKVSPFLSVRMLSKLFIDCRNIPRKAINKIKRGVKGA